MIPKYKLTLALVAGFAFIANSLLAQIAAPAHNVSERIPGGGITISCTFSGWVGNILDADDFAEIFASEFDTDNILVVCRVDEVAVNDCGELGAWGSGTAYCPTPIGASSAAPYATCAISGMANVQADGYPCAANLNLCVDADCVSMWRIDTGDLENLKKEVLLWIALWGSEQKIQRNFIKGLRIGGSPRACISAATAEVGNLKVIGRRVSNGGFLVTSQGFGVGPAVFPEGFNVGMHLVCPIQNGVSFTDVRAFASVGDSLYVNVHESGEEWMNYSAVALAFYTIR